MPAYGTRRPGSHCSGPAEMRPHPSPILLNVMTLFELSYFARGSFTRTRRFSLREPPTPDRRRTPHLVAKPSHRACQWALFLGVHDQCRQQQTEPEVRDELTRA